MSTYEQKPKTWSLFPMNDEDAQKKKDFYYEKGWDESKAPNWSGKMILEDGTVVRLEGRMIEGQRGDFFSGSCYIPNGQGGGTRSNGGDRDRGGDRGTSRDGGRDRDRSAGRDRGDDRGGRGRDDRSSRDDRGADRGRDRDDRGGSRGGWSDDDDVPF